MSTSAVGAWSAWNFTLSAEATKVFNAATSGILGVSYSAVAFASQVVAGTNYSFLCWAKSATNPAMVYPVQMHVFAPLQGNPTIQGIERLGPDANGMPGGYGSWSVPATAEAVKVLNEALSGLLGVNYAALGDTVQIVAGSNYCYLCSGNILDPGSSTIAALIYVNQPLNGKPHLAQIVRILPH